MTDEDSGNHEDTRVIARIANERAKHAGSMAEDAKRSSSEAHSRLDQMAPLLARVDQTLISVNSSQKKLEANDSTLFEKIDAIEKKETDKLSKWFWIGVSVVGGAIVALITHGPAILKAVLG